jgi:Lrp/AsnC family transcriptional regulator, regulator for asnA, asnC and gidA
VSNWRTTWGVRVPFALDAIDRQIVSLLLEDGRISSAEITRRIGHVSERAVRYRIERLVRSGVIRISAIVNPQAVGFTVTGDVLIDVAPGKLQDVAAQLVEFPTVSYVAGSVGEGDLSVQVYARDTEELLRFVNEVIGKVAGVTRTKLAMVPWKLKDVYQWHVPVEVAEEGRANH